ncbi:hypothetical protein N482_21025 [Pseudoalteromonas luteoviolacea NCIMB 1942]|uniref:Uncharacterized protein n=1 Tax=Pseudoalteromonas luteoviolacea NCIMB 1942 TaxID=1365253 RepID=A0A166XMX2_9GAMM|nr:hypothetical protein N482_21025 [Pseudoalteromonas luteoviolacea NCIMB 1942]
MNIKTLKSENEFSQAINTITEAFMADPVWSWMYPTESARLEAYPVFARAFTKKATTMVVSILMILLTRFQHGLNLTWNLMNMRSLMLFPIPFNLKKLAMLFLAYLNNLRLTIPGNVGTYL